MNRREQRQFYQSSQWRRASKACRARAGWLCERCKSEGYTVAAVLAHHRTALDQKGEPLAESNLEALCRRHHEEVHDRAPTEARRAWSTYLSHLRKTI